MEKKYYQIRNLFFVFILSVVAGCSEKPARDFTKEQLEFSRSELSKALQKIDPAGKLHKNVQVDMQIDNSTIRNREGYKISIDKNSINIIGGSGAGVLYGTDEATRLISENKGLPENWEQEESPAMKWRGISLQLMKLGEYNFAITPKEFPFFYDKALWTKFLDFMADQRFNYIILWNGHPFDYFVKFDQYKEAQSGISDKQIHQNHDMLKWLIAEGGKRNIKFFFEFYNINTSVFYQEAHHLPKQLSTPTPELAAYTEYSISKFVSEFPEVGLFVTPGEGLERKYSDYWINNVIFKAIKSTGYSPTVFMRAWFFDLEHARKIINNYADLYFVRKFNVEMIADKRVDPENTEWAKLNANFVVNIHLAANLEPFRWNPPSYIQSIVKNNIASGARNIHLHPRKAWRWPYGSDTGTKEYQWQRDTLFFTAWSRYAWNPERDKNADKAYWINLLAKRFGNREAAIHYIKSSETGADVLPALQRLVWLGYDNHTIVTTGATIEQLEQSKGIPFLDLKTLRLSEFVDALKKGIPIQKKTPVELLARKVADATTALQEAGLALSAATSHIGEMQRIVKDTEAELYVAQFYYHKVQALKALVLLNENRDVKRNKKQFFNLLTASVDDYEKLCKVTLPLYESVSDVPPSHPVRLEKTPYHWNDFLVLYQKELAIYKHELNIKHGPDFYLPKLASLAGVSYSEPHFADPISVGPVKNIDFNWNNDLEIGRNWSFKWLGFLKAPVNGPLKILISSDRALQMKVGKEYMDMDPAGPFKTEKEIQCKKGDFYRLEILYDHDGGEGGFVKLEWAWKGHPFEVIPGRFMFHSESQNKQTSLVPQLLKAMEGVQK